MGQWPHPVRIATWPPGRGSTRTYPATPHAERPPRPELIGLLLISTQTRKEQARGLPLPGLRF